LDLPAGLALPIHHHASGIAMDIAMVLPNAAFQAIHISHLQSWAYEAVLRRGEFEPREFWLQATTSAAFQPPAPSATFQ
jgi:hypothetical protein